MYGSSRTRLSGCGHRYNANHVLAVKPQVVDIKRCVLCMDGKIDRIRLVLVRLHNRARRFNANVQYRGIFHYIGLRDGQIYRIRLVLDYIIG